MEIALNKLVARDKHIPPVSLQKYRQQLVPIMANHISMYKAKDGPYSFPSNNHMYSWKKRESVHHKI